MRAQGAPIVVKADGLAAGKGVVVAQTVAEAEAAIDMMFGGGLGEAGAEVVIEEFLERRGSLASSRCATARPRSRLPSAQDHKRAFDGDRGPNTGGMGAYSPAPVMTAEIVAARHGRDRAADRARDESRWARPYKGVLYRRADDHRARDRS